MAITTIKQDKESRRLLRCAEEAGGLQPGMGKICGALPRTLVGSNERIIDVKAAIKAKNELVKALKICKRLVEATGNSWEAEGYARKAITKEKEENRLNPFSELEAGVCLVFSVVFAGIGAGAGALNNAILNLGKPIFIAISAALGVLLGWTALGVITFRDSLKYWRTSRHSVKVLETASGAGAEEIGKLIESEAGDVERLQEYKKKLKEHRREMWMG